VYSIERFSHHSTSFYPLFNYAPYAHILMYNFPKVYVDETVRMVIFPNFGVFQIIRISMNVLR